jgi:hypothetical protein
MDTLLTIHLRLSPDAQAQLSTLAEALQRLVQVAQRPVHGIEAFLGLLSVNGDPLLAVRADEGGAVLEPTQRLLDATAAARALDIDLRGVEGAHASISAGCVATPTVPEPGPDHNDPVRAEGAKREGC